MHFKTLYAYLQLSRPVNVLMAIAGVIIGCFIAGAGNSDLAHVLLAAISVGFLACSANAINDVFDLEIDRVNKPKRPLPSETLLRIYAKRMWFLCAFAAAMLTAGIGFPPLIMMIAAIGILYWYSACLKRTVLLGNIIAAGVTAGMIFLFSGIVIGHIKRSLIPALFAFVSNLGREIVKDIEDREGDRLEQAKTLPVQYGINTARRLFTAFMLVLVLTTIAAIALHLYNYYFLIFVLPVDVCIFGLIIAVWFSDSTRAMHRISVLLKICMVWGLLGIFLGTLPVHRITP